MNHFKNKSVKTAISEELENVPLQIQGKMPDWLEGVFVRNGPVDVTIDGKKETHWFDGLAMLHAFHISDGKIHYSNRFLRTEAYHTVFDEGSLNYLGFASDPCRSKFKRLFTYFFPPSQPPLQNTNINVSKIAEQFIAMTETPLPICFDQKTLRTVGVLDFQDSLPHSSSWESAHPHQNTSTLDTTNYLIEYGYNSYYVIYKIDAGTIRREVVGKILVDRPSYMHSFALTENYIILVEYPFVINPLKFLLSNKPFINNFFWCPERGTRFSIISRQTGEMVTQLKSEACFAFHHANAYEEGNRIILDLVEYTDASVIEKINHADFQSYTTLMRYAIDIKEQNIHRVPLFQGLIEFPRINNHFDGKFYRYLYLADPSDPQSSTDFRPLYKWDHSTASMKIWSESGCYPGEPVYVKNPQNEEEDGGLILTIVIDMLHNNSFLLILDAKTFKEIARADTPHLIPKGLHGQFFDL